MKLKQLLTDDSAVSPVIGVILMVAITVILAAVIGSFVLNLGGSLQNSAPQASFGFDYKSDEPFGSNDTVEVTHETGDSIEAEQLSVTSSINIQETNALAGTTANAWSGTVGAGDTTNYTVTDWNGETVRVVWESETGENTATLIVIKEVIYW